MHEKILDEPDFSNFNSAKQARLDLRRLRIRRYLIAFWTIFIGCFSFAIALAYSTNMREAAQMFGLANTDDMGNIFVAILVAAIVGYIGGTINWFRYELLPYTLAWPLSTCRDALYKRASRYGITAAAFIVIPLFLYLNFSLPQFGSIIGVPRMSST